MERKFVVTCDGLAVRHEGCNGKIIMTEKEAIARVKMYPEVVKQVFELVERKIETKETIV